MTLSAEYLPTNAAAVHVSHIHSKENHRLNSLLDLFVSTDCTKYISIKLINEIEELKNNGTTNK